VNRRLALCSLLAVAGVAAAAAATPETVVDDLDHEVHLASPPQRIVSLAPSITELLFAIGLGPRVVGVTEYCNYPPAAAGIERVAGFSDLSVERIAAVRPDLVVASRGNDPEGLETLRQLGVPVFGLANNSVAEVVASVRRLGRLTGARARAEALADSLAARVAAVRDAVADRPRPTVLWGIVGDPIYTAGAGSVIDDVIRVAGGDNVGARAGSGWPQVSLETVVDWAPEVFLTSVYTDSATAMAAALDTQLAQMRSLDGWRNLPCVRQDRQVHVDADVLTRPGPRLVDAVEILARALHPDAGIGAAE
jgi:iron complex transport system substrate-binding protein